jgi:hypothetical protein
MDSKVERDIAPLLVMVAMIPEISRAQDSCTARNNPTLPPNHSLMKR